MRCDSTDPDLMRRVRSLEDDGAWARFVETYRRPILKHCQSYGLTADQSEEVTQDCLLSCSRYLPTFEYLEAVGRFRTWLNLTVNQRIGECFRSRLRDEALKRRYTRMLLELAGPSPAASHEATDHDHELLSMALQRVRGSVRPQQWQLFEAFVLHGMTAAEVGAQLAVSPVLVRVTAFRVRSRLRRVWKALHHDPF